MGCRGVGGLIGVGPPVAPRRPPGRIGRPPSAPSKQPAERPPPTHRPLTRVPDQIRAEIQPSGSSRHTLRIRTSVTASNHRRITAPHTRTFNHGAALAARPEPSGAHEAVACFMHARVRRPPGGELRRNSVKIVSLPRAPPRPCRHPSPRRAAIFMPTRVRHRRVEN